MKISTFATMFSSLCDNQTHSWRSLICFKHLLPCNHWANQHESSQETSSQCPLLNSFKFIGSMQNSGFHETTLMTTKFSSKKRWSIFKLICRHVPCVSTITQSSLLQIASSTGFNCITCPVGSVVDNSTNTCRPCSGKNQSMYYLFFVFISYLCTMPWKVETQE